MGCFVCSSAVLDSSEDLSPIAEEYEEENADQQDDQKDDDDDDDESESGAYFQYPADDGPIKPTSKQSQQPSGMCVCVGAPCTRTYIHTRT